jgi:hypothetical protein
LTITSQQHKLPKRVAQAAGDFTKGRHVTEIFDTTIQLVLTLLTLIVAVGALSFRHLLFIVWVAWWLWGVNWNKAWGVLARGGWVPVVLLTLIAAAVWAALAPSSYDVLSLFPVANFWWQLGAVTLVVLLALFCGWLQGVLGWTPPEINLEPPEPAHAHHDHGHGHH